MVSVLLLLLTSFTLASPPSAAVVSEHRRLQQEIARLAERHIWVGVERTWMDLLENGLEPSDADCVHAAHAAMAAGDLATARARWMRVARRTERRDVIDSLYRIDHDYGRVHLSGSHELVMETLPFLPEAAAVVQRASRQVADTGAFEGHLPPGRYRFGYDIITVEAGAFLTLELERAEAPPSRRFGWTW